MCTCTMNQLNIFYNNYYCYDKMKDACPLNTTCDLLDTCELTHYHH